MAADHALLPTFNKLGLNQWCRVVAEPNYIPTGKDIAKYLGVTGRPSTGTWTTTARRKPGFVLADLCAVSGLSTYAGGRKT